MSGSVQIPGYRVERQLGRGGMASVFLALQESVQRRVALKVMSQVLLVDDAFSDRFIREARIAANLNHPHIVAVHDVGVHDNDHYIAMEFLAGGDLAERCAADGGGDGEQGGCSVADAIRVVREIASALEYAHRKGFVHRDVKPENILFRDNGSAVLTDFGIARAVNSATQMTKTGAVIGTPQYMSPEQARGKEVDGRSDLYSLGVVFYEMLTGSVPYEAADSVAVGIKHITEPVPKLPLKLSAVQPVLERFLAKKPEQRYASGGEAYVDLQRLEERFAKSASKAPRVSAATEAVPVIAVGETADATPLQDAPRFGELDQLAIDPDLRRRRPRAKRRSIGRGLVLLLLASAVTAGWYWRDRLPIEQWLVRFGLVEVSSELELGEPDPVATVPESTASDGPQLVVDEGPTAIKSIELKTPEDTAIDTPRLIAIEQATALRTTIEQAITSGDFAAAEAQLAQLEAVSEAAPELAGLRTRLESARQLADEKAKTAAEQAEREVAEQAQAQAEAQAQAQIERLARQQKIDTLLQQAQAAREAGRWASPTETSAVAFYRQILQVDGGNVAAARGLREVTQHFVDEAEAALEADELERVGELIATIQSIAPDASALTQIRRRLTLYRQQRERSQVSVEDRATVERSLSLAEQAMAAGSLMHPPGGSAWDQLKTALRLDPKNVQARDLMARLGGLLSDDAERLLAAGQLEAAAGRIEQIRQVDPAHGRLPLLGRRAGEQAAAAAEQALNGQQLQQASELLDLAERLQPGLPQLEALRLRLNIAREQSQSEPAASG